MTQQYPHYGPQGSFSAAPPQAPKNALGGWALGLGIAGTVLALIPFIGLVGFFCGLVGVVLGLVGWMRVSKGRASNRGVTIAGIVLSIVAVIVSVVVWNSTANAIGPKTVTPADGSASSAPAAQGQQQSDYEAGQAADIEGLVITAGPIKKVRQQYGDPLLCSDVTYENRSDETPSYNGLDWKLQDPKKNIVTTTFGGPDGTLSAGQLAPGGQVAGKVCFTDPKLPGEYFIINEEFVSFSSTPVRWKTSL